ncbi:hypothetical protein [Chitinimonas sp. BJYL2]|uniref:hypothetical protein n=1 Tax=Chitinimonas sp. BJYL2 TaxID=2976696 RepID=UPI0022B405E9|nr:hypothetical protein [Chitinimonas sp. BJYL2]
MHALTVFAIEIIASLLLSLLVVVYLRDVLQALLAEACPRTGGAFWIKILALLQFMAPLMLVVWRADLNPHANLAVELKQAFLWMLIGHCAALLVLARTVWRRLVAVSPLPGASA